jgi:type IV secretory pathway component VirB8
MLFRKHDGSIVEIKRSTYKNDSLYYVSIMKTLGHESKREIETSKYKNNYSTQAITKLLDNFC